jgi:hypothetical protein
LTNQTGDERRIQIVSLRVARQLRSVDDRVQQSIRLRIALSGRR